MQLIGSSYVHRSTAAERNNWSMKRLLRRVEHFGHTVQNDSHFALKVQGMEISGQRKLTRCFRGIVLGFVGAVNNAFTRKSRRIYQCFDKLDMVFLLLHDSKNGEGDGGV
ncbi:uncharacterized protein LOC125316525 [Rhodamnia argentea]|uniref:Uncharacterized protein LOC125316525 n=1 Tax=Rhodamnia argentea TaxID=178133 RepID=A0ABM3HWK3_9MYRT|nr:uncharacterized protein LOC125316525 [Rhodamnia argentea]